MKRFFQRLDNSSNYKDYQREGPSSHTSSGSFIGKVYTLKQYQCTVEDVIAEGGFAFVFLVKAQNGMRYALKRLNVNNEHDLTNCKREIEIAKKLGSHKNIVQLVESTINFSGNEVFEILMLMQYCKGHLLQLMNEKISTGFTEAEVIRIICDLCEAIARMHHNDPPIIHRDLKIENILISEDGNYLLCDFGSATTKVLSTETGQSALSIEEEIKRYTTLAYRSPEMIDVYSGKAITTKSDIWALGCLIYKLCYFNLPFGESTLAIQNAHLIIPDSHAERYTQRIPALIAYMLSPDPEERPDIYQVASLAFELIGLDCPIENRNKSTVSSWSDLRVPPTETIARELKKSTTTNLSNSTSHSNTLYVEKTSVTPRQRPKARGTDANDMDPFEAAPFKTDQLKRYFERQRSSIDQSQPTTPQATILVNVSEPTQVDSIQTDSQSQNTVITIRSNDYTITNTGNINFEPKAAAAPAAAQTLMVSKDTSEQPTKPTSNQSISSSSQGLTVNSPTTNYMPLYSSDTAEEDNDSDSDDSIKEQLSTSNDNEQEDCVAHFETSADLTKPLVDDDEEEDEGEQNEDDNIAEVESSIGSASDLQHSDDESNDETDSSNKLDDNNSSDHDNSGISDGFELVNFDDTVINTRFRYGLVKNHSPDSLKTDPTPTKPVSIHNHVNISRIEIKSVNSGDNSSGNISAHHDDETSVSNSSISFKNIDSIDHLIGHVEGHRPLLEDEEEEESTNVKPFIEIDQVVDYVPMPTTISVNDTSKTDVFSVESSPVVSNTITETQPINYTFTPNYSFEPEKDYANLSTLNHEPVVPRKSTLHSDFETLSLQQISDETEENRRLDEEVELSLNMQVIYDQMTNKDLFGSIPFTDKDLINNSVLTTKSEPTPSNTTAVAEQVVGKFETSFTELTEPVLEVQPTASSANNTTVETVSKSTDLFGAVPFSGPTTNETISNADTQRPTISTVAINKAPPTSVKASAAPPITLHKPNTISVISQPKSSTITVTPKAPVSVSSTVLKGAKPSNSVPIQPASTSLIGVNITSKLNRNQMQKSNSKIKSKVVKKYEVDESDDEGDVLIDQSNFNDEENFLGGQLVDSKKKKKDKKEKQEKKSKEKKEDKKKEEKKAKEKVEKAEKSKQKDKSKEKDKEKEKSVKAEKEKKEKKVKKEKEPKSGGKVLNAVEIDDKPSKSKILTKLGDGTISGKQLTGNKKSDVASSSNEHKESSKKITKHQAFANMSFEDENHHHGGTNQQSSNIIQITRC